MGILIFVDDYLNIMTLSTCMRKLTDRQKVPRETLSYIIDSTRAGVRPAALLHLGGVLCRAVLRRGGHPGAGLRERHQHLLRCDPLHLLRHRGGALVPLFSLGWCPSWGG